VWIGIAIGVSIEFIAERICNAYKQYKFRMKQKRLSEDFQSGKLSINELREKYNLPPLEGCDVRTTTDLPNKRKDVCD
jgi:hypothetical protein